MFLHMTPNDVKQSFNRDMSVQNYRPHELRFPFVVNWAVVDKCIIFFGLWDLADLKSVDCSLWRYSEAAISAAETISETISEARSSLQGNPKSLASTQFNIRGFLFVFYEMLSLSNTPQNLLIFHIKTTTFHDSTQITVWELIILTTLSSL